MFQSESGTYGTAFMLLNIGHLLLMQQGIFMNLGQEN